MHNELRAVLVGCGGISNAWFNAVAGIPECSIVGLVDLDLDRVRQRAEEHQLAEAVQGDDLEKVLGEARPDVVFDCTVPEAHQSVSLAALAAGCHVMSEKPLAHSMDAARSIVDAAARAGKLHAVMQNRRHLPSIRRFREMVRNGIGDLTTLNADFYIGAHFGGFRDRMEHVLLLDMAIHTFDAARFISGKDPVAVYCREWNPAGSWYDHDASAQALFEMSDGVLYSYRGSWCAEGMNTSWESDWRAVGNSGSVCWDGAENLRGQAVRRTEGFRSEWADVQPPEDATPDAPAGHAGGLHEFVHAVLTGGTPQTVCTDNIKSLAMVFGAIESAEKGERVDIRV